ncbi:MAG: glycosyltransferase [Desulfovibrio sp.]|nr:glycosyltransferase [Desulfovibrio sp.]
MPRPASVTIVTPSFNQAAFLPGTLASVRAQAGDYRLEHLVLDGGSTDGSVDLLRQAAAGFPALDWTSGPDGGQADAVNTGWRRARGDILGWLNSDDRYRPGAVARVLDCFERQPGLMLVYGEAVWIDPHNAPLGRYPTLPPPVPLQAFADGCFLCQPSVFFRRQLLERIGMLDTALHFSMDMEFWMRAFAALPAQAIGFVPQVQAESRLHDAAKTLRDRTAVMLESMAVLARHLGHAPPHWVLTWVEEILAEHPQSPVPVPFPGQGSGQDPAPWAALWRQIAPLLTPAGAREVQARLAGNRRLALLTPTLGVDMHPDGWSGHTLALRIRRQAPRERCDLTLHLPWGMPVPVEYRLARNGVVLEEGRREMPGTFLRSLLLGNPAHLPGALDEITLTITRQEPHPTDPRTLGFQVQDITVTPLG